MTEIKDLGTIWKKNFLIQLICNMLYLFVAVTLILPGAFGLSILTSGVNAGSPVFKWEFWTVLFYLLSAVLFILTLIMASRIFMIKTVVLSTGSLLNLYCSVNIIGIVIRSPKISAFKIKGINEGFNPPITTLGSNIVTPFSEYF